MAGFYDSQGKYAEALPLYQRALASMRRRWGRTTQTTAISLNSLAALYFAQGNFGAAEPLLRRALKIVEKTLGAHPDTVRGLNNVAALLDKRLRRFEAATLRKRAVAMAGRLKARDKAASRPPK